LSQTIRGSNSETCMERQWVDPPAQSSKIIRIIDPGNLINSSIVCI
jgi:hypothetical protein